SSGLRRPPPSALFPYTTLFRSARVVLPAILRDPARHHLQHRADRLEAGRRAGHVRLDRGAVLRTVARHLARPLGGVPALVPAVRSEEHTSELQSRENLVCRLLL